MVRIQFEVKHQGYLSDIKAFGGKRTFNRIVLEPAWTDVAELWHDEIRPKHFTMQGGREYEYKPRKGENLPRGSKAFKRSYFGRKFNLTGHLDPLVYSGKTKKESEAQPPITATSKGVALKYGLNTLSYRHPKSNIFMQREFGVISRADMERMAPYMGERITHHLNLAKAGQTHTETIS